MERSHIQASHLTIGQLAKAGGVSVETIRFYERRGLIEQPGRPTSGIRRYPRRTLERLKFIRQAQSLGFTLQEVQDMLELKADDPATCREVQRLAEDKIGLLRTKMQTLRSLETILKTLVEDCHKQSGGDVCFCPLLEAVQEGRAGDSRKPS